MREGQPLANSQSTWVSFILLLTQNVNSPGQTGENPFARSRDRGFLSPCTACCNRRASSFGEGTQGFAPGNGHKCPAPEIQNRSPCRPSMRVKAHHGCEFLTCVT